MTVQQFPQLSFCLKENLCLSIKMPASSRERDPRQECIRENRNSFETCFYHLFDIHKAEYSVIYLKIYLLIVITSLIIGNIFRTHLRPVSIICLIFTRLNTQ